MHKACITNKYTLVTTYIASIYYCTDIVFCTVSCSCDIGTDNDDTIQSVCTGPSEAPCIMCGPDRCQVSYVDPYNVIIYVHNTVMYNGDLEGLHVPCQNMNQNQFYLMR